MVSYEYERLAEPLLHHALKLRMALRRIIVASGASACFKTLEDTETLMMTLQVGGTAYKHDQKDFHLAFSASLD